MARLHIIEYPDDRLRRKAPLVTDFDASLSERVDDLLDTLYASGTGVGLCAPQVGDLRQILVMDLSGNQSEPQVFVNPRITAKAALGLAEESCLSVPGTVVYTFRSAQVRVEAQDRTGASFERELSHMAAVCLQHEMDHFDGKLLVDRMSFLRRWHFDWTRRRASA